MTKGLPVKRRVPKLLLRPIEDIARAVGIKKKYQELYGPHKAKVSLDILPSIEKKKRGKYILVTSATPTPYGDGKTVTCIGLLMALNRLKKKAMACITQPALGDIFGIKNSGSGGGFSQAFPKEDISLHLTGDSHAVSAAQNLCAAYLDNSIYYGNPTNIETESIMWKRATEANDRSLRATSTGLGGKSDGISRKTGFELTSSGELMAILALSADIKDMRERIGRIILGFTKKGKPVTCEDIKVAGSMAVLLKDALKPNLLQTTEGGACFMHAASSGDGGLGVSSVISDRIALGLSDYVITEAAFGADIGAEKFFNIKCRTSGIKPDVAVIVSSVRGLKMHSGDFEINPEKALPREILRENVSAVERGFSNLEKQIENLQVFGIPVVLCINRFKEDTEKELHALKRRVLSQGVSGIAESNAWTAGGEGSAELAAAVMEACKVKHGFRFLYPLDMSIKDKVRRIAKTIYGAKMVNFSDEAAENATLLKKLKLDKLPICISKTHMSLSHNPKRKGRPHGFKFPVEDVRISGGAGYINVITDNITILPDLPKNPRGTKIDINAEGKITGLF